MFWNFPLEQLRDSSRTIQNSSRTVLDSRTKFRRGCSVVNLSKFPSSDEDLSDYGNADVATLVDYFHDGLSDAGVETNKCETEWTKLKDQISKRFSEPHSTTWEQVNEKLGQLCPNFLSLVDLILTIPASSADAERGFNRMKITKSDWRSKLTDCNLSDQLMIMLESCDISTFDPMPAISLWMSGATRRLRQDKETNSAVTSADKHPVVQATSAENPKEPGEVYTPASTSAVVKSTLTSGIKNPVVQATAAEIPKEPEVVHTAVVKLPDVQLTDVPTTVSQATMTDIMPVPQMSTTGTMTEPISRAVPVAEHDEAYMSDDDYSNEAQEDLEFDATLKGRLHAASNAWQNFCDILDIRAC